VATTSRLESPGDEVSIDINASPEKVWALIAGAATRVSEAYESVSWPRWVRPLMRIPGMKAKAGRDTHRGMETTLARLKVAAEGEAH
jgi:uncharacterized protein YndB with AHSA1/START domain